MQASARKLADTLDTVAYANDRACAKTEFKKQQKRRYHII